MVEGFASVVFHHAANRNIACRDFRGMASGYMTAGWWAPGQMAKNLVSWETAQAPAKQKTTFVFVGATSVVPSEFARGPAVKLSVNGQYALTFTLGMTRDFTWQEGGYALKYESKRVEYPYFGSQRALELNGNSGIYRLTVPAEAVEAGKPVLLAAELQPFERWNGGWFMVKERRDALSETTPSLAAEVEVLRRDMERVNEQMHVLATQVYRQALGREGFVDRVIYSNGYRHLHPADLIPLRNGELLLTAREAAEHYAADGDVIMLRSRDGGLTWGEKQIIAHDDHLDLREGCGVQLRDGTIVVGVFYNGNYNPDGSYRFKDNPRNVALAPGKPRLGTFIITSRDNGRTWSAPNFISTRGMPFSSTEGPTDAPIEMPDGSIVMGVIGYGLNGDAKNTGAVMMRSTDQGATWTYLSTIASDPGGKLGAFLEPGILRTKSGRIVAGLRNGGPDQAIYTTYSDDDGKTWQPPRKTAMHGHPVDLMQLADGRVMATYGIRPPIHARPGGIRACFSRDDGATWDLATEVQIRNDFLNWDVGYPESIELPDGRVLSVYYYNLFGKYFLGGTHWKP